MFMTTQYHGDFKCVGAQWYSCVRLFVTALTGVRQAPLSMGFPRQEYCSRLPFPSPGDFPKPGFELRSPALQAEFTF